MTEIHGAFAVPIVGGIALILTALSELEDHWPPAGPILTAIIVGSFIYFFSDCGHDTEQPTPAPHQKILE